MPPTDADADEAMRTFASLATTAEATSDEAMVAELDRYLTATGSCRCFGLGIVAPQFVAQTMRADGHSWPTHCPSSTSIGQAVMEASVRSYLADDPMAAAARLLTLHNVDGCAGTREVIVAAVMLYVEIYRHHLGLHAPGPRGWLARRRYRARRRSRA